MKNEMYLVFVILAVFGVVLISGCIGSIPPINKCDWRLSDLETGPFTALSSGVYFNGEECIGYVASNTPNNLPFESIEECQQECEN